MSYISSVPPGRSHSSGLRVDTCLISVPVYFKAVEEEATEEVFDHSIQVEDLRIDRSLESLIIGPDTVLHFHHLHTLHCDNAHDKGPMLLEAPKGHVNFQEGEWIGHFFD
jgi:hypothetical protein